MKKIVFNNSRPQCRLLPLILGLILCFTIKHAQATLTQGGSIQLRNNSPQTVCWNKLINLTLTTPSGLSNVHSINVYITRFNYNNTTNAPDNAYLIKGVKGGSVQNIDHDQNGEWGNGFYRALFIVVPNGGGNNDSFISSLSTSIDLGLNLRFDGPLIKINNRFELTENVHVLSCEGITLHQFTNCTDPSGNVSLSVQEITATGTSVGTELIRTLNPTERTAVNNGTFDVVNFCATGVGGNTLIFQDDKWYRIKLIGWYPGWYETAKYIHFSTGNHDLIMRDFPGDIGIESHDGSTFASEDIWNRHFVLAQAGTFNAQGSHQDPDHVTTVGNENRLYVRIRNQGCVASTSKNLNLYWTRARSTELWPLHFNYNNPNNFVWSSNLGTSVCAGAEVTIVNKAVYSSASAPLTIPAISAESGYTLDLTFPAGGAWLPPNPNWYDANNGSFNTTVQRPVICLLAKLEHTPGDPVSFEPATGTNVNVDFYARKNNNVVTRNTLLYDEPSFLVTDPNNGNHNHGWATLLVNNGTGTTQNVRLCLNEVTNNATAFSNFGTIQIGVDNNLWNAWSNGGFQGSGIQVLQTGVIRLTNVNNACLDNITLSPNAEYTFGALFDYNANATPPATIQNYTYSIQQHYNGETEHVGTPSYLYLSVPSSGEGTGTGEKPAHTDNVGISNITEIDAIAFPNPFSEDINIRFALPTTSTVTITVTDIQGQLIKTLMEDKELEQGTYETVLRNHDMAKGLYILNISAGTYTQTIKINHQ